MIDLKYIVISFNGTFQFILQSEVMIIMILRFSSHNNVEQELRAKKALSLLRLSLEVSLSALTPRKQPT